MGFAAPVAPAAPVPPAQGASPTVVADWRERQDEWRARYEGWKRQQADASRAAREGRWSDASRRQADAVEQATLRRLSQPRTSGSFVAIALGVALMAGALAAAFAWSVPALSDYPAAFGCAAATAVVGLSMLTAALLRRRSGSLAFVAIVLVCITAALLVGVSGIGSLPEDVYRFVS